MRVISKRRLREFWEVHPEAQTPLTVWYRWMLAKDYANPAEVRRDFARASLLGGTRTVFNIGGNRYRLVVTMRYDLGRVYVRHVLTHAEYDKLSAREAL